MASAWLQRAHRLLAEDPDCVEHGALVLREAENSHGRGDLAGAVTLAEQALALGRRLPSVDLEAEALQTLGRLRMDQARTAEGMAHLDEAMLLAVEGRLGPYSTGKVYCSLISACEAVGDLARAAEWTESTLRWAEHHPFAIFPGICRVHRAIILKGRGDLAGAEREASRACDELASSHRPLSAAAFAEVGDIRRRLGQLDAAEEAFARARSFSGGPCGGVALLRLAQGRLAEARADRRELPGRRRPPAQPGAAAADRRPGGCRRGGPRRRPGLAGRARRGAGLVRRAGGAGGGAGGPREAAAGPRRRCRCRARACRRPSAAGTAWPCPTRPRRARTVLGHALRRVGDETAAGEAFAAATELFARIGAALDGGAAPEHPDGLSEREVEVLRLVATGRSNAQVAAALYLSPKTVSRHLANIFTKIGVTSRAAATAFAFEHHLAAARR